MNILQWCHLILGSKRQANYAILSTTGFLAFSGFPRSTIGHTNLSAIHKQYREAKSTSNTIKFKIISRSIRKTNLILTYKSKKTDRHHRTERKGKIWKCYSTYDPENVKYPVGIKLYKDFSVFFHEHSPTLITWYLHILRLRTYDAFLKAFFGWNFRLPNNIVWHFELCVDVIRCWVVCFCFVIWRVKYT